MLEFWKFSVSFFGDSFKDGLNEHDLIYKMPVSNHVFSQNLNYPISVTPVVYGIEGPQIFVTSHRCLTNVFQHPHLIQQLVIRLVVLLWYLFVLLQIRCQCQLIRILIALFMNYFLLNRLNLRPLFLLLHRVILEHSKSTFLSTVKCWWPLSSVKFLHVFDRYFFTHLLFFVVDERIFVVIRIKS